MTDKQVKDAQYQHKTNSNLVLQGQNKDGSERPARAGGQDLPSGEGESLTGHQLARFGDKVVRQRPNLEGSQTISAKDVRGKEEAGSKLSPDVTSQLADPNSISKQPTSRASEPAYVNFATLEVNQDLIYRPQTRDTRALYEQIVHLLQRRLGDLSIETVKDAVDEVLSVLKDDGLNDRQRRIEIDGLLGLDRLTDEEFGTLTVLARSLTDYQASAAHRQGAPGRLTQQYQDQAYQDIAIDPDDEEDANQENQIMKEVVELEDQENHEHEVIDEVEQKDQHVFDEKES